MQIDFETAWAGHREMVSRFLMRFLDDPNDVEEVLQRTSDRAWRGMATFQGRSKVSSWLLRIAENEAKRWLTRKRFAALDPTTEPVAQSETAPAHWDSRRAIEDALSAGLLTSAEARVLTARLDSPDATWADLAAGLGITSANAAQLNVRGVSKLRVYLMVRHPELCGSRSHIADAFEWACQRAVDPLDDAERRVFRAVVLDRTARATDPGLWTTVQSACRKVAAHLPPEGST